MNPSSAAAPALTATRDRLLWFHERFGKPQLYALLLLGAFLGQCLWLAAHSSLSALEISYISPAHSGSAQEVGRAGSPLVSMLARLPVLAGFPANPDSALWHMLLRAPFILVGALLGASVWYVSRRLYGNAGGYIALTLYAFSPPLIQRWSVIQPDALAAWGVFGCIFTGIAVAHTLYAPREVVLWNWRRILLLGVSIGVAAAAAFSAILAVPLALAFMLYLVPHRRTATVAILAAACVVGAFVFFASCSFSPGQALALVHANSLRPTTGSIGEGVLYAVFGGFLMRNGPAFMTLLLVALGAYIGWKKTRFFGTTAPLIVAAIFFLLAVTVAHQNVLVFLSAGLPFLFVFAAGITTDLLEIRNSYSSLITAVILAIVASHALFSIMGLWRIAHGG